MKPLFPRTAPGNSPGFTLVEVMTSMTIVGLVMGLVLATFVNGLRALYKDTQRLATNATLRYFIAQVAKQTLDSTEFYVFPTYQSLNGNVSLTADPSTQQADAFGTYIGYGDCLVLVTRVATDNTTSNVRRFRIYYRVTTLPDSQAPIRYYDSGDYGSAGTASLLTTLLNGVNLNLNPSLSGSVQIVPNARGRLKNPVPTSAPYGYPIFATESSTATAVNTAVSVNVEIINGTTVNNLLSSSSFNYTISPRK